MAWSRTRELGTPQLVHLLPLRRRQSGRCHRVHGCEVPGHDLRAGQQVVSLGLAGCRPGVLRRGSLRRVIAFCPRRRIWRKSEMAAGSTWRTGAARWLQGRRPRARWRSRSGQRPPGRGVDAGSRVPVTGRVANGRQCGTSWRCRLAAGRLRCSGSSPAAGRWQPHRLPVFCCGQRPGTLAKQVAQAPVASAGGRSDQMLVMRSLRVAAGGGPAGARQRRGGVGVDAGPGCRLCWQSSRRGQQVGLVSKAEMLQRSVDSQLA
jgi:hypothetical protein